MADTGYRQKVNGKADAVTRDSVGAGESLNSSQAADSITCLQIGSEWLSENTGGLQRMHFELHRHLPRSGIKSVGVVAGTPGVAKRTNGEVVGAADPTMPVFQRMSRFRAATKSMVEKHQPDVIASHFPLYALPALDILREYPTVMHLHGPWALESKREGQSLLVTKAKYYIEKKVYSRSTSYIVLSEAFKELFSQKYDVPEEQITIIPAGVDADRFDTGHSRREAAEAIGWPTDRPIILVVRRLVQRMGLENLIEAVDKVREDESDILVHIAGTGPLKEKLQQQIDNRDLSNHVRLVGFVPEEHLALAYRAASASMVPTTALEGMGCITLESLAAGTPVLVTPVGGLPEAVGPLSDDLVLEDCSLESIIEGLQRAVAERASLPSSAECQQYVRNNFAWQQIAARVGDVYRDAIGATK